ncbi:MAG: hypothetical protein AB7S26_16225 [Sandaracinaceae bacterium]
MRREHTRGFGSAMSALMALALWAGPSLAVAQNAPQAPPASQPADEYTRLIAEGVRLMASGDSDGGIDQIHRAVSLDGARPEGPYYLAVANRVAGSLEDALSGFRRAAELAQRANEPRWQARSLQGVAMTLERMEGRLEEARTAWQAYVTFADAHTTVSFPAIGRGRIQAIDVMTEQENAYVAVRERIAEREREQASERRRSR